MIDLCGVKLKNPVIAASGTFGFGGEYSEFYDVGKLGGLCTKGLTLEPRQGNSGLRVFETEAGMMNSVGLQNPGIPHFLEYELPEMLKFGTVIIANLGGGTIEEYVGGAALLDSSKVDIIELNISCPNVKHGGMAFGIQSEAAAEVVRAVRQKTSKPLMVKLSPNAEDVADMARVCVKAGADSLSLVNTFKAMAIDIKMRRPVFDNVTAGLSGPAIKPIALRMVYEVCNTVNVPVVGLGGIMNTNDALEFIMAGASAIQVGTANFCNPLAGLEIAEGLAKYDLEEIRGCV
ncbi:dihydroorotate dehydrogenase [Clostridia bacterium]|nr:dihydroorotate dehydrogenase [Clostridia bacterium]